MSAPGRTGHDTPTDQTEQYVLNYSFDEVFKILCVALVAYNPNTNTMDRVQVNAAGELVTSGSTGGGTSTSAYAVRMDKTSTTNITYVGKATPGTLTSAATWQIMKMDKTADLIITWADGDANFNNIWNNRTGLSYS